MARLPVEAADALVVDAVFLVMSSVVAGEAECYLRHSIAEGKVVELLEEGKSIEMMEGVCKVGFLFVDDGVSGPNIFEASVCLVSMV